MTTETTNGDIEVACPRCGTRLLVLTKTAWKSMGRTKVSDTSTEVTVFEVTTEAGKHVHVCEERPLRRMLIIAATFERAETFIETNGDLPGWDVEIILRTAHPDFLRGKQYHAAVMLDAPCSERVRDEVHHTTRLGDEVVVADAHPETVLDLD